MQWVGCCILLKRQLAVGDPFASPKPVAGLAVRYAGNNRRSFVEMPSSESRRWLAVSVSEWRERHCRPVRPRNVLSLDQRYRGDQLSDVGMVGRLMTVCLMTQST